MYLIQIFLPLYDNRNRNIPRRRFDATARELTERFGGLSAHTRAPITGLWKKSSQHTRRDELIIFEVMAPRLNKRWWRTYRLQLEQEYRQERILIRAQTVEPL